MAVQHFFGNQPIWVWIATALTVFGDSPGLMVISASLLWLHGRKIGYRFIGIVIFAAAIDGILWATFKVQRPHEAGLVLRTHLDVASFPSGHTVVSTAYFGLMALIGYIPWIVPILLVPMIMVARLYMAAHYLGDVIFAVPIGLVILYIFRRVSPGIGRWLAQRSCTQLFLIGAAMVLASLPALLITSRGEMVVGAALGMGIGAPAEWCYVRYQPKRLSNGRKVGLLAIGLIGMGILAVPLLLQVPPVVKLAATALILLWVLLVAPWLFIKLGFGEPEKKVQGSHQALEA